MGWIGLVYNHEISIDVPFFVKVDRSLTRDITWAHHWPDREAALDAATAAAFEGELIGADYIEPVESIFSIYP